MRALEVKKMKNSADEGRKKKHVATYKSQIIATFCNMVFLH